MRRKAFTIIELIVAVIILGVLATFAIGQYQGFIENADAQACETKQKALQTSLDIYSLDHDTIPGAYSEIPEEYIQKAFASLMRQKGSWKIKLAFLVVDWRQKGFFRSVVYAQSLDRLSDLAKGDPSLLRCPKAGTGAAISYGINKAIQGKRSSYYRRMKREFPDFLVIGDSNNNEITGEGDLTRRHFVSGASGGFGCGVTISGETLRELGKRLNSTYNPKIDFSAFINDLHSRGGFTVTAPADTNVWPENKS